MKKLDESQTKQAYKILFSQYFGNELTDIYMKNMNWREVLLGDNQAFNEELGDNPGYTQNDYFDLIAAADPYGIRDFYVNQNEAMKDVLDEVNKVKQSNPVFIKVSDEQIANALHSEEANLPVILLSPHSFLNDLAIENNNIETAEKNQLALKKQLHAGNKKSHSPRH